MVLITYERKEGRPFFEFYVVMSQPIDPDMPKEFWPKLWYKTKKDPLVPIGCVATLGW